ncbi:MAG: Mrr restriction system protein [Syntrophales bacterium]|jgi:restriction system protein|nr:Mrr restriction system protein [Syntrophales bacterium]MDY0045218.1 restriction endonuclease [Syntrophales bacterium]
MAEITKRRLGELVRGVFKILLKHPDGLPAKEVLGQLADIVPPTPFEASMYPNRPNVRRYEKIVRFSTINTVKAGWLLKDKGSWSLTDEGRAAFVKFSDAEDFHRAARKLYRKWKADQPAGGNDEEEVDVGEAATTLEEAAESAWSQIENFLEGMSPYDFQELVAGLLRGMGYYVDWISPPGPDRGIDIVAHTDPLGVKGPRIKVQVKRRADKITVDGIRGFMALLGDSDVGLFVCTGGFTRDAEEEARRQEKRRIMLLDLKKLFDLWTEHYNRIPEAQRQLLPLRPVYYLAPDE